MDYVEAGEFHRHRAPVRLERAAEGKLHKYHFVNENFAVVNSAKGTPVEVWSLELPKFKNGVWVLKVGEHPDGRDKERYVDGNGKPLFAHR